jgi:hypothetical protein
LRTQNLYPDR